ncbi:hypothetical protein CLV30_12868 [Haloactinopolyspora alba]|uniref:Uncharacterized protein n=1 Tax=Haloactinopolyspora alba TaxID=648780 RepID=A0A2P8DF12_9ACTN|nr:hypothetical protein [Haloactinopolyspora alba]PSK95816.1 hypothetical protein CLV30_12868 [Haloactinopolyspora alba]
MATPDRFVTRVDAAVERATPSTLASVDQLAALWRDYFDARDLDLTSEPVSDASLRTMAMMYGLLMAAHQTGELSDEAWNVISDVISSSTAAVTVTKASAVPA